jgi:hypothetical protein
MWPTLAIVIIFVGFIVDRAFKRANPKAYFVFKKVVWTIEGLFIAAALIGVLCRYWAGSLG